MRKTAKLAGPVFFLCLAERDPGDMPGDRPAVFLGMIAVSVRRDNDRPLLYRPFRAVFAGTVSGPVFVPERIDHGDVHLHGMQVQRTAGSRRMIDRSVLRDQDQLFLFFLLFLPDDQRSRADPEPPAASLHYRKPEA